MSLQDRAVVRTAADLEKKYNFAKLLGLSQNIETNSENLIKVQNELNNMLNTLIINLGDVLDSQSDISLWFYQGVPTTSNNPYISWDNPDDHIGDIYYDQNSGYVYKYTSTGWIQQSDLNLINAMALTNAELDVSTDHERKVFISQPTIPYSSGDWWILEDGTLKICQLGKESGEYDSNDFVVSSKYVTTVASKQDNTITVLKGTVTEISDNYVSVTDLATGGSTTIAGENITTGNIKSANYSQGVSGTNINLNDGKISTKNVTIDDEGMKLSNGAKVVGNNGLKNTYLYESEGMLGYSINWETMEYINESLTVSFNIPPGLNVTKANMYLVHTPVYWDDGSGMPIGWGKARNIKLARATNLYTRMICATFSSSMWANDDDTTYDKTSAAVVNAFGSSGWTPPTNGSEPSLANHPTDSTVSTDIKDAIVTGFNTFKIYCPDASSGLPEEDAAKRTGWVHVLLEIEGYMTYS